MVKVVWIKQHIKGIQVDTHYVNVPEAKYRSHSMHACLDAAKATVLLMGSGRAPCMLIQH